MCYMQLIDLKDFNKNLSVSPRTYHVHFTTYTCLPAHLPRALYHVSPRALTTCLSGDSLMWASCMTMCLTRVLDTPYSLSILHSPLAESGSDPGTVSVSDFKILL